MGEIPHGQSHNIRFSLLSLSFGLMATRPTKTGLTFGSLVANFCNTYGERRAKGILRLAVKANLVVFPGLDRYVVSRATRNA